MTRVMMYNIESAWYVLVIGIDRQYPIANVLYLNQAHMGE